MGCPEAGVCKCADCPHKSPTHQPSYHCHSHNAGCHLACPTD